MIRLDRERLVEMVSAPWENIEYDLRYIWDFHVTKGLEMHLAAHDIYDSMGESLIDYNGIDNGVRYFTELREKFWSLGQTVAFLCGEYQSSGLKKEEPIWLGMKVAHYKNAGKLTFRSGDYLAQKEPIRDCSPEELAMLYVCYLEGQSLFFTRQYKYDLLVPPEIMDMDIEDPIQVMRLLQTNTMVLRERLKQELTAGRNLQRWIP